MATLSPSPKRPALGRWARRVLAGSTLALLAAGEAPVNLYGWPVFVAPAPLQGDPTRVPAYRSEENVRRLTGGWVTKADYASDGEVLLGPDMELGLLTTWDSVTAIDLDGSGQRWTLEAESEREAAFSPDGAFAILHSESEVSVLDLRSGRRRATWDLEDDDDWLRVSAIAVSPDGAQAALFRDDTTEIEVREVPGGALLQSFSAADAADTLRFSADGELLFGFGSAGLRVWELDSGRVRYVEDDVRWRGGAVNADFSVAYLVGNEGLVEAIELKQGGRRQAWRVPGGHDLYRAVALEDGRVAVGGEAPALFVIDTRSGRLTHALEGDGQLSLSADGQWLRATEEGQWAAWRVKDLQPRRAGSRHIATVQALALGAGYVASGDERGSVYVRRALDGALVTHIFGDTGPVASLAIPPERSPAAGMVLVGDDWGQIWAFDLKTGRERYRLDFGSVGWEAGEVAALAFSEDGRTFAAGLRGDDCSSCGEVRFYDAATFELLGALKGEGYDRLVPWRGLFIASGYESDARVLSPKGPAAMRGEPDHYEAEIWAAARGDGALVIAREGRDADLLYPLGEPDPLELDTCGTLALSSDGRRLIAEDCDGGLAVLDTVSGRQLQSIPFPVDEGDDWIYAAVADDSVLALGWASGRVSLHGFSGAPAAGAKVGGGPLGPLATLSGEEGWVAPTRSASAAAVPESLPAQLASVQRRGDCGAPIAVDGGLSVCASGRVQLRRDGDVIEESDYMGYGELLARGRVAWHVADGKLSRIALSADGLRVEWTRPVPARSIQDFAQGGSRLLVVSPYVSVIADAESGEVLAFLEGHPGGAELGALSPDGALAATASREGAVIWKDGVPWMFIPEDASEGVAFSEDGRALLLRGRQGGVSAWAIGR